MIAEVILLSEEERHPIPVEVDGVASSADVESSIQTIYCSVYYAKLGRKSLLKCLHNERS